MLGEQLSTPWITIPSKRPSWTTIALLFEDSGRPYLLTLDNNFMAVLGNSCTFKRFWWYAGSLVDLHDFMLFDVVWHGGKEQLQSRKRWLDQRSLSHWPGLLSTIRCTEQNIKASLMVFVCCFPLLLFKLFFFAPWLGKLQEISFIICYFLTTSFSRPFLRSELNPSGASFLASIRSSQALNL